MSSGDNDSGRRARPLILIHVGRIARRAGGEEEIYTCKITYPRTSVGPRRTRVRTSMGADEIENVCDERSGAGGEEVVLCCVVERVPCGRAVGPSQLYPVGT